MSGAIAHITLPLFLVKSQRPRQMRELHVSSHHLPRRRCSITQIVPTGTAILARKSATRRYPAGPGATCPIRAAAESSTHADESVTARLIANSGCGYWAAVLLPVLSRSDSVEEALPFGVLLIERRLRRLERPDQVRYLGACDGISEDATDLLCRRRRERRGRRYGG